MCSRSDHFNFNLVNQTIYQQPVWSNVTFPRPKIIASKCMIPKFFFKNFIPRKSLHNFTQFGHFKTALFQPLNVLFKTGG